MFSRCWQHFLPIWLAAILLSFALTVTCVTQHQDNTVSVGVPKSDLFAYGLENGDSTTPIVDDGFSGPIFLNFPFPFFNETYRSLWVNTNGAVSFRQGIREYTPTCGALGPQSTMVAPFWADIDINNGGRIYYRETNNRTLRAKAVAEIKRAFPQLLTVGSASLFIATWDDVAYFGEACAGQNHSRNTFQLILSTDGVHSFSLLYYNQVSWTTGRLSGGNCSGLTGQPAKAGFDVGDGQTFFELPGTCSDDILHIPGTSNMGEDGKWIFRVDNTLQNSSCNDDTAPKLQISPSFVSVYGHEPLSILGPCLDETVLDEDVVCRFHDPLGGAPSQEPIPAWLNRNESLVVCPAPFLYTLGRVEVDVIVTRRGGGESSENSHESERQDIYKGYVYVVESPTADVEAEFSQIGAEDSNLVSVQLTWEPETFPDVVAELEVAMWEIGSENTWKKVGVIGQVAQPSLGHFVATVDTSNLDSLVIFELTPTRLQNMTLRRLPILPVLHLLRRAYTIYKWVNRFNKIKNALSCNRWYASDTGVPTDIEPCPCFLRQAERDPRFKREEFLLSYYHPGAAAGFRQRESSPSGAGQQCTYDGEGNLITHGAGAGSADKSSPNNATGFIAHLKNDVWPWFICHKFSDNVDKYYAKRRADNCRGYRDPGLGGGVGDPHITTFDLTSYTFNGAGEFWMIQTTSSDFGMQARLEIFNDPNTGVPTKSSVFTAFVMDDTETKIQIELSPVGGVDIRLDDELVSFVDDANNGSNVSHFIPGRTASISVSTNPTTTITVSFVTGFTFTFTKVDASFGVLALADETRVGTTNGLLGYFDRNPDNDLRTPAGLEIPANSSLETLHYQFGLEWMVRSAQESLFVYSRGLSYESYAKPEFVPSFETPDLSQIPEQVLTLCDGSIQCLFDYLATGSLTFANATREQGQTFNETRDSLQEKIYLCSPITVLENGYVNYTTNFINGTRIQFGCNERYELDRHAELTCGFVAG